jgi:hypothetical protein
VSSPSPPASPTRTSLDAAHAVAVVVFVFVEEGHDVHDPTAPPGPPEAGDGVRRCAVVVVVMRSSRENVSAKGGQRTGSRERHTPRNAARTIDRGSPPSRVLRAPLTSVEGGRAATRWGDGTVDRDLRGPRLPGVDVGRFAGRKLQLA